MEDVWRGVVRRQFGAALERSENAVRAGPDELWGDRGRRPEFRHVVFHTLFYLDLYLYKLRHVQHHVAQLNFLLRQTTVDAPRWVAAAKE